MRAQRLRRTHDIEVVREDGQLRADRYFTLRARPNGLDVVRVAVSAAGGLGTAVRRNRARRRVREAIREALRGRRSAPGTDLFVVARPPALDAPSAAIRAAVTKELESVLGPERA